MKFAEFFNGQRLEFGDYVVSEEEIVSFATQFDPQPFHVDKDRAGRSRGVAGSRAAFPHLWRGEEFDCAACPRRIRVDGLARPGLRHVVDPP